MVDFNIWCGDDVSIIDLNPWEGFLMTIAAAFQCIDGIVLSSDTQESYGGFKRQVSKLEVRGGKKPGKLTRSPCAVFCGATNDGHFFDMLIEKLWSSMEKVGREGLERMIEELENELIRQYQRFLPVYPQGVPESSILIGIWAAPDKYQLVRVDGAIVNRSVILEAAGCGDILATYIANRLLWPKTWKEQAIPIGIYMVDQAKQYVEYCGGDTHLVIIAPDGTIERYSSSEVEAETDRIRKLDIFARQLVGMCMSPFQSREQFEILIEDRLRDLRKIIIFKDAEKRGK